MSGFFGLIRLDGRPAALETLQAMGQAMAGWGGEPAFWNQAEAGFGCLGSPGEPASRFPYHDPQQGLVFLAHGRIDERPAGVASGAWMLQSYLSQGAGCVDGLDGDWSLAAWDARQRRLCLARDPHGISSLYFCARPEFFVFASSIKALLALPEIPKRPNLLRVAEVLVTLPGDGSLTAYEGISQLPPAHTLALADGKLELRCYWRPQELKPLRLESDEAYLEAFLDIYSRAVRARLAPAVDGEDAPPAVGATLSGGLDSGSVCALAARELKSRGQRLPVFTSVPLYDTSSLAMRQRFGNELPLVELDAQFIGNLDVFPVRSEDVSPLAGLALALEIHDSPAHATGNAFWINSLLRAARRQGIDVLLTGQTGNASISWLGGVENFWPLLLTGRWGALQSRARRLNLPLWKVVWRHFLRAPLLAPLSEAWNRQRPRPDAYWLDGTAINPRLAHSLELAPQLRDSGRRSHDPFQERLQILRPGENNIGAMWAENSAAYGLQVRDPTMDRRLVEFCLAIPDEQYRLDGLDRSLVRRAMQGLLPDAVRLGQRRGLQAADLGYRLLAELPEVQALLGRLEKSELACEVLDLPKMNGVLQALQQQVNLQTTLQSMVLLTRGLMAGMFLLRFG